MVDRLSVNLLLKSVIAALSTAVVIMLALSAWNSWTRLAAASRIAAVAEASGHLFTALHNLRVDRASSYRDLMADKSSPSMPPLLRKSRESEMPALKSALVALESVDFPGRQAAIDSLAQSIKKLTTLHEESRGCVHASEGGAPAGARAGILQPHERASGDARQAVVAPDAAGEARRRLCRPIDGAQAACLGGAQRRRRRLGHDLQQAGRTAASARCRCSSTWPT